MAAKKRRRLSRKPDTPQTGRPAAGAREYRVRRVAEPDVYELAPPQSVVRRAADLEEVHAMLEAGEIDVAADELRWLLEGCHALLEAHKLLGEIAASDDDLQLARGHFGYAYQLGVAALPATGLAGTLPYARPANRAFFEAGKGLAWCLEKLGQRDLAAGVIQQLVALDPADPLALKALEGGESV